MKLEEFNKLTVTCRCICYTISGMPFDVQGYEARQWALDSIRESKNTPQNKRMRPRVFYDGGRVLMIGVDSKIYAGTQEEVTP